ncbi:helix-turn-helix transcriptional regulator [Saccharothrix violaceirubra]|uniref:DUF5753 domain-containing protein n=1 Tax=Saccharothrix violaceirubra TaxID=413306 RepID=A0A7W7T9K0_9PSEU|nr:helix-turn-helix transcriptional regulator [Saccharothrix violaceirubra]MBB4968936.1 hypothetical protein [Saccharothrix violaceirubra]
MAVGTTRGKRKLGALMAKYLHQSGAKAEHVIKEIRIGRTTWNRMLNGEARPRWSGFIAILSVLNLTEEERRRAIDLWEVADYEAMPIEHVDVLPRPYVRFRRDETEAVSERSIDLLLIPGIFQTADYASALAGGSGLLLVGEGRTERVAPERLDRQALLHRKPNPLVVHALIDESALCREIGGQATMAAQLDWLVELSTLPNVTIQILPSTAGAHGALSGTLTFLDFPEVDDPGAVYAESLISLDTVENEEGVARFHAVWDDVVGRALSVESSIEVIRAARETRGS